MSEFHKDLLGSGTAVVETLTGNSGGPVAPTGGNIDVVGSGAITVVGNPIASSLTIQLTGITNHSLVVGTGTAALTNLGVATNGQLPIGSTGADPVLATLTAGANVTITNAAGSITIAANAGAATLNYTPVNFAMSPYTVLATDDYIGANVTGGAITIRLPNAPATGRIFAVKDVAGLAAASNITVTTVGGAVLIDGAATYVMNSAYAAISLIFNSTSYELY